jgi:cytidine deaminase
VDDQKLFQIALDAKEMAYAPYSGYKVGAALLSDRGLVYTGVNVENASYGATNCAERAAVFRAITDGERKFTAIAIAADGEQLPYPCGICRQVLAEFGEPGMRIICGSSNGKLAVHTMEELLPHSFKL